LAALSTIRERWRKEEREEEERGDGATATT
jgi:hypothetical protein